MVAWNPRKRRQKVLRTPHHYKAPADHGGLEPEKAPPESPSDTTPLQSARRSWWLGTRESAARKSFGHHTITKRPPIMVAWNPRKRRQKVLRTPHHYKAP